MAREFIDFSAIASAQGDFALDGHAIIPSRTFGAIHVGFKQWCSFLLRTRIVKHKFPVS